MNSPLVTVVVPIYNAEKIIERSLDLLCNQTLREIEIICVDDGSTDSTAELLDAFAKTDSRIKVIHQENGGAGAARNTGLQQATGEYLSFLDIDDIFKPNMLERAYEEAKKKNLDILVFRADHYFPANKRYESCVWSIQERLIPEKTPFSGMDVEKDIFKVFVGWPWDKLFKMHFVRETNLSYQKLRTTNDMLFVFSAIVRAKRIDYIDDVLIHHVKEEGSLSVTREKSWGCFYEALTALKNQLVEWNLYERFEQDFINYCVHASLWNVHTLAEPTKSLLINKLRDEWADDLSIFAHEKDYFYNKSEYNEFRNIYTNRR